MQDAQLTNTASAVAGQIADLLNTWVAVLDARGSVIARAGHGSASGDDFHPRAGAETAYLSVHASVEGRPVRVLAGKPQNPAQSGKEAARFLIESFLDQQTPYDKAEDEFDARNRLVASLIGRGDLNKKSLASRARQLNIDLDRPRIVMLLNVGGSLSAQEPPPPRPQVGDLPGEDYPALVSAALHSLSRFFADKGDALCGYIAPDQVVILKASGTDDLRTWIRSGELQRFGENWASLQAAKVTAHALVERLDAEMGQPTYIGIGRQYSGAQGIAQSYYDAQLALVAGLSLPTTDRVLSIDSVGLEALALVPDIEVKAAVARELLAPLDQDEELWKTLWVFFKENCSPGMAAHRLNLHRNSVSYRLDRLTGLIGLDPRKIDEALEIRLAMHINEHSGTRAAQVALKVPTAPEHETQRVGNMHSAAPPGYQLASRHFSR